MPPAEHTILRILDANLNRAREALRVMEEFARFGLDDADLSTTAKQLRHDLAGSLPGTLDPHLIAHREILTDVGRHVHTEDEYNRSHAVDVVKAAAKRLTEALRAIEEYGKTLEPAFAARIEQLRYRAYELERRLLITSGARQRWGRTSLYVLITEALCQDDWLATAKAALRGGADCLQLREKNLPDGELLDRARRLAALCHEHNALCLVNDRPDIAALSGADGVHLGQDDMDVASARRILPRDGLVGVSTHTIEQVKDAIQTCPDYLAVGPMFASPTKPQDHLAGVDTLAQARRLTAIPLVAIGGINERNAGQVLAAAPACLCVCAAVITRRDVHAAAARIKTAIAQATPRSTR